MADLQVTAWVILSDDDECNAKLGDIRGGNLSLKFWRIECNRENMSEKSHGGFQGRHRLLFLLHSEIHEMRVWVDRRTENKGNATLTQLLAFSSINSRESMDVRHAMERPAQRAPGSFE